jgi:hypothetical protein
MLLPALYTEVQIVYVVSILIKTGTIVLWDIQHRRKQHKIQQHLQNVLKII